ncbi:hypothetical protein [Kribbella deserti]|uniref:Phage tail protein n=1 Tax=Kribbella deserti TaxID=1926257 RepID=A0ABV6QDW0_9ACTN
MQWLEAAGDGSQYRGERALSRDIDLPLYLAGRNRTHLKGLVDQLALVLAGGCVLRFIDDDGSTWFTTVHRVGGGEYIYGTDTNGHDDLQLVVTLRAPEPYWTSGEISSHAVRRDTTHRGLIPALSRLHLTAAQSMGEVTFTNPGTADAYPTWDIVGPGNNFKAISPRGELLHWTGTLALGQRLTIDTRTGSVKDGSGANRYAELAPAPKLWRIPPGESTATASMEGTAPGTIARVGSPRLNHVTNPSLETGLTGYTGADDGPPSPLLEHDTAFALSGSASLRITTTPDAIRPRAELPVTGLSIGQSYWACASTYLPADTELDSRAWLSIADQSVSTSQTGAWVNLEVSFTATAISHTLRLGAPLGARVWWDQVYVGTTQGYFDGSTPNSDTTEHEWTGTPHESSSRAWTIQIAGASWIRCTWRARKTMLV